MSTQEEAIGVSTVIIVWDMPPFHSCVEYLMCILRKNRNENNLLHIMRLQNHMWDCGLQTCLPLANYIITVLVDIGSVFHAQNVFDGLPSRDESLWNSLLLGYFNQRELQQTIFIYKKMREECQHMDGYSFVVLLKACALLKDMETGHEVHSQISNAGLLDRNIFICSTLVDMYAKCGCMNKAQEAFDGFSVRTTVLWNTLITGYMESEDDDIVFNCFQQMQHEGICPDDVTFVCILKVCSNIGSLEKGMAIHVEMERKCFVKGVVVGSALVDMYAKCGWLNEALEVFNKLPDRNVIVWNALITGYVEHAWYEEAQECFTKMQADAIASNAITLICMLKTSAELNDTDKYERVHDEIVKKGLESRLEVGSALVDLYAKVGKLQIAQQVFGKLPIRDAISWNTIIAGCIEQECCSEGLHFYEVMQCQGLSPDSVSRILVLKACGTIQDIAKLQEINFDTVMKGLERDIHIMNTLVDAYIRCGLLLEAQEVFDKIPSRLAVSWNALILGYTEHAQYEEALHTFENMKRNNVCMDAVTFVAVLKPACELCDMLQITKIHVDILSRGFLETDIYTGSALVSVYAKCGSIAEAEIVFNKLSLQDEVLWTAMITGYTEYGLYEDAFRLFKAMPKGSFHHNPITLACALKIVGCMSAVGEGFNIHAEVIQRGLPDADSLIANALVEMYFMCGFFTEAHNMFEKHAIKDQLLCAMYIQHASSEEAMRWFDKMQNAGIPSSSVIFASCLKACAYINDAIKGREMHAEIVKKGLEREHAIVNSLVYMYAKCGLTEESKSIYTISIFTDRTSSTALITGYLESGHSNEAMCCFEHLHLTGSPFGSSTYACSLKACGSIGAIVKGQVIHSEIVKMGLEGEHLFGSILVDMYMKCELLAEGRYIFYHLQICDALSWNALISGYAEHERYDAVLRCFEKMQQECVVSDCVVYVSVLKTCSSTGYMYKGQQIHSELVKKGLETEPIVGNCLIDMYVKCWSIADARDVFDKLPTKNVISCTALSSGYIHCEHSDEALNCLHEMQNEGLLLSSVAFICGLKASRDMASQMKGRELHTEIIKRGLLEREAFIGSILVDLYIHCSLLVDAKAVFDSLPHKDVVAWTSLISGCIEHGLGEVALGYFQQVQEEGISEDIVMLLCGLKACCSIGASVKGEEIHAKILKKGLERDALVGEMLVDLYAKCGFLVRAQFVFDRLLDKDTDLWNALISGNAQLGDYENVLQVFDRMVGEGTLPDLVTFVHVLTACSHAGHVVEGQMVLKAITNEYKVITTLDHFSCIVDLLGRAGCIDHLVTVIDIMPFHPDNVVWLTVLGACKKWGNLEHGQWAFEHAMILSKKDAAAYVCMSNIYADAAHLDYYGNSYFI